jgi:hypothetical protein
MPCCMCALFPLDMQMFIHSMYATVWCNLFTWSHYFSNWRFVRQLAETKLTTSTNAEVKILEIIHIFPINHKFAAVTKTISPNLTLKLRILKWSRVGQRKEYLHAFLTSVLEGFCLSAVHPGYFVSGGKRFQPQKFRAEIRIINLHKGFLYLLVSSYVSIIDVDGYYCTR